MPAKAEAAYTAKHLLRDASAQGTPANQRLITDWVAKGLLDGPARRSLGRGRGSAPAVWPENQRKLFLLLLNKRREATRVATLCNVPVALWIYFGPEYVPVSQVRRALRTFGGAHRTESARAARQSARLVADQLAVPRTRPKARPDLIDAIVAATSGGVLDRGTLLAEARRVFDPDDSGREVGPPGARLSPEAWVNIVEARLAALDQLEEIDDSAFETARLTHHQGLQQYEDRQPEYARDPEVGAMFEPLSFERLVNTACLDLLTVLGLIVLGRRDAAASTQPP